MVEKKEMKLNNLMFVHKNWYLQPDKLEIPDVHHILAYISITLEQTWLIFSTSPRHFCFHVDLLTAT